MIETEHFYTAIFSPIANRFSSSSQHVCRIIEDERKKKKKNDVKYVPLKKNERKEKRQRNRSNMETV